MVLEESSIQPVRSFCFHREQVACLPCGLHTKAAAGASVTFCSHGEFFSSLSTVGRGGSRGAACLETAEKVQLISVFYLKSQEQDLLELSRNPWF